jgi:hypothetical protein
MNKLQMAGGAEQETPGIEINRCAKIKKNPDRYLSVRIFSIFSGFL